MVGDIVQSLTLRGKRRLELSVVGVTFANSMKTETWNDQDAAGSVYLKVELHLPPHRFKNIIDFEERYEDFIREWK
jgi:hypothetical protein